MHRHTTRTSGRFGSLLLGLLALYLTGCASTPAPGAASQAAAQTESAEKLQAEKVAADKAAAEKAAGKGTDDASLKARNAAAGANAAVAAAPKAAADAVAALEKQRSAYFDFDRFEVRADDQATLKRHADLLSGQRILKVRIEGNADERGSREYNLALGQKRAEAMRTVLKSYGVSDDRMEAVSNGKEKPRATGHDEAAWAENRRGDLMYPGQ